MSTPYLGSIAVSSDAGSDGTFVAPSVTLRNSSPQGSPAAWFGAGSAITVGNGFPVYPGECLTLDIPDDSPLDLWFIAESGIQCYAWGFQSS